MMIRAFCFSAAVTIPSWFVFKSLNIYSGGILRAQTGCELNFAVDRIIVCDKAAEEPDDDGRRFCGILVRGSRVQGNILARGEDGQKEANTNTSRRNYPAEESQADLKK